MYCNACISIADMPDPIPITELSGDEKDRRRRKAEEERRKEEKKEEEMARKEEEDRLDEARVIAEQERRERRVREFCEEIQRDNEKQRLEDEREEKERTIQREERKAARKKIEEEEARQLGAYDRLQEVREMMARAKEAEKEYHEEMERKKEELKKKEEEEKKRKETENKKRIEDEKIDRRPREVTMQDIDRANEATRRALRWHKEQVANYANIETLMDSMSGKGGDSDEEFERVSTIHKALTDERPPLTDDPSQPAQNWKSIKEYLSNSGSSEDAYREFNDIRTHALARSDLEIKIRMAEQNELILRMNAVNLRSEEKTKETLDGVLPVRKYKTFDRTKDREEEEAEEEEEEAEEEEEEAEEEEEEEEEPEEGRETADMENVDDDEKEEAAEESGEMHYSMMGRITRPENTEHGSEETAKDMDTLQKEAASTPKRDTPTQKRKKIPVPCTPGTTRRVKQWVSMEPENVQDTHGKKTFSNQIYMEQKTREDRSDATKKLCYPMGEFNTMGMANMLDKHTDKIFWSKQYMSSGDILKARVSASDASKMIDPLFLEILTMTGKVDTGGRTYMMESEMDQYKLSFFGVLYGVLCEDVNNLCKARAYYLRTLDTGAATGIDMTMNLKEGVSAIKMHADILKQHMTGATALYRNDIITLYKQ